MSCFISYIRVSTAQQGASGLGLESQRETIAMMLKSNGGDLVREFIEIESGRNDDRPVLKEAMAFAKRRGCRMIFAKIDRLSRDVRFLLALHDQNVPFLFCDLPSADRFSLTILAAVAEREAKLISERTKAALAAARARGVKLGNPKGIATFGPDGHRKGGKASGKIAKAKARAAAEAYRDLFESMTGMSSLAMAQELNDRGERTPRGSQWRAQQVIRLKHRLGLPVA